MPKKNKKSNMFSQQVVDHWPEVFNEIEIKAIPVEYLSSIFIKFVDDKIWEIDIDHEKIESSTAEELEESLEALLEEYEDVIVNVDFRLDTEKVKKDISRRTKLFMKKRK